ncbi:putative HLA class I histocompatibility antigen, alpha chain H [Polymixia lowei]
MVDEVEVASCDTKTQRAVSKHDWMKKAVTDNLQIQETSTKYCVYLQQRSKTDIDTVKQRFNQTGGVHVYQRMSGCEWDDETGDTDGYNQHGYDGEDFLSLDMKTMTWIAQRPQASTITQQWNQNKAELAFRKNFYTKRCIAWLKMFVDYGKSFLQRTVLLQDGTFQMSVHLDLSSVTPDDWKRFDCVVRLSDVKDDIITKLDQSVIRTNWMTHTMMYFLTGSTEVPNFPEYVTVVMVDEVEVAYCDSNTQRAEPKQDWMKKSLTDDPQIWETNTGYCLDYQHRSKTDIDIVKQHFNQTGGVHVYQIIFGCEWDDETGDTDGYNQHGYDGEDFMSLDMKTMTWIASRPQAVTIKLRRDQDKAQLAFMKYFFTNQCIAWLKKIMDYGKSFLQRTVHPSVSLLQKSPSSPVTCHATGFYPDRVKVFWRRDGEELHEHVDHGELLTNQDGTFQMSVHLNLSSVTPDDWKRFDCVVQLSGVKDDIITKLDQSVIRTNWKRDLTVPIITIIIISVFILSVIITVVIGVIMYMKEKAPDSELSDKLNPEG